MKKVKLGSQGLVVPQVGLGCMGMTKFAGHDVYKTADQEEAINTIHRALELGGNFLDTADQYGPGDNERLLGKAIQGKRDQYTIATKRLRSREKECNCDDKPRLDRTPMIE